VIIWKSHHSQVQQTTKKSFHLHHCQILPYSFGLSSPFKIVNLFLSTLICPRHSIIHDIRRENKAEKFKWWCIWSQVTIFHTRSKFKLASQGCIHVEFDICFHRSLSRSWVLPTQISSFGRVSASEYLFWTLSEQWKMSSCWI